MAKFASIALLLLACASYAVALPTIFGGATSINNYATSLINSYNALNTILRAGPYLSIGSGQGIAGFTNGSIPIGASDDPLNTIQDAAAGGTSKFTLPLALGTFSFETKKSSTLKLNASTIAKILQGKITQWSQVAAGLTGTIQVIARADSSGTTQIINSYLTAELGSSVWNLSGSATWQGSPYIVSTAQYYTGTGGVATATAANVNAITYLQTGVGVFDYKLYAIALKNPAGNFINGTTANPQLSVPATIPAANASWATVSLLRGSNAQAYPIVSFEYMFAKKKYTNATIGTIVRNFLTYTQGAGQNNATRFYFFPLPTAIITQNTNAIKQIS